MAAGVGRTGRLMVTGMPERRGVPGIADCCIPYYHSSAMTTISCKIPEKLDAELASLARRQRVSKSTVIRQALERHVKRRGQVSPRAFDLVKSLCGVLHGPSDLSTNPRHLEGLGA
jgi:hypothetical protein